VSLVADQGFTDINICYSSPRGDDLDTRLLRAMVIKGILEEITTSRVNLVNADLLAKNRGLRISEVTVTSNGRCVLGGVAVGWWLGVRPGGSVACMSAWADPTPA
jgi:D-3-phosphoglycerate dehydrogenase